MSYTYPYFLKGKLFRKPAVDVPAKALYEMIKAFEDTYDAFYLTIL